MPPSPPLDEHGFPIPPTFEGHAPARRPGEFLGGAWKFLLVLAFVGLLAGLLLKSELAGGAKKIIAGQLVSRAEQKHDLGDMPSALADLDRAASWSPDNPKIYQLRAEWKLETNDVAGSLEDYDRLIRLAPRHAPAYMGRSQVYQRLDRHREAIEDLTKAIHLSPSREPTPRNNRAYARALANIELDEALVDVQQALDMVEQRAADAQRSMESDLSIALINVHKSAYLDTRGYINFLQEKYELALEDLNQAIELANSSQERMISAMPTSRRAAVQTQFNHELAVMYHHRGQVYEKLGRTREAKSDLDHGDDLGYNPAAGVF
jgi:tetratricopeptide (TPR) repeat protein